MGNNVKTITKTITLPDTFTNSESDWLSDLICEKLEELGYENVISFSFDIIVDFEGES